MDEYYAKSEIRHCLLKSRNEVYEYFIKTDLTVTTKAGFVKLKSPKMITPNS